MSVRNPWSQALCLWLVQSESLLACPLKHGIKDKLDLILTCKSSWRKRRCYLDVQPGYNDTICSNGWLSGNILI